MPTVSVIIPTYNSARYVTAAIESVLAQTSQGFEILVIDDGSTDETEQLMRKYQAPVRYLRQANGGVSVARNHGIAESRGHYVAFLDADDTWFPHKLERQLTAMKKHPEMRVSCTAFTVVDNDLTPIGMQHNQLPKITLDDLLTSGNVVGSICTVIGERALFTASGGFDPSFSQCADWDMWVRLAAQTDFLYLDESLVTYRQHNNNMSRNAPLLEHDSVRVLEKGFAMAGLSDSLRSRRRAALARNNMVLAGTYFHAHRYFDFVRCASKAIAMDVRQVGYLVDFPARITARMKAPHLPEAL